MNQSQNVLDLETQKSFEYLREVEELAQDILTDKEVKLELSNARNKYREAFRALESVDERKSWIKIGSVYMQLPTDECKNILKEEIDNATKDIDNLREEIKKKLCKMRDVEHEPELKGLGLKPLPNKEMKALYKNFGIN